MSDALGMVEIKGLASAIAVADVMVKTAEVRLMGTERARGHGWTTIKVMGDVAAVNAAVSAGVEKARECGCLVSSRVIPRPVQDVKELFCAAPGKKAAVKKEKPADTRENIEAGTAQKPVKKTGGKKKGGTGSAETDRKSL